VPQLSARGGDIGRDGFFAWIGGYCRQIDDSTPSKHSIRRNRGDRPASGAAEIGLEGRQDREQSHPTEHRSHADNVLLVAQQPTFQEFANSIIINSE
jgi:hypothetical protein